MLGTNNLKENTPSLKQTEKAAENPKSSSNIQERTDYWKHIVQQQAEKHRWKKKECCMSHSV